MSGLAISNLSHAYLGQNVLNGVSLRLGEGEVAVLIGPSGAGKTTLLRLIAGLEDLQTGSIELDGQSLQRVPPHQRKVQMVFQDLALFPHLSARANVEFAAPGQGREWLARVGFQPDPERRPALLSGGERQRVALARALAARPRLLLLDEPFLNLDPPSRRKLVALLAYLRQRERLSMLYVTHFLEDALLLADRLLFLDQGHLELQGPLCDVLRASASPALDEFRGRAACVLAALQPDCQAEASLLVQSAQRLELLYQRREQLWRVSQDEREYRVLLEDS
ncbi:MAG: ABC transporter ATP-binding protein [Vulcanimicrobiota bacterium]